MDEQSERARWDYEQTVSGIRALTEIRFKLLAFIPPLSGAAIALLTRTDINSDTRGVIGGLGFVVIVGVVVYDQRNSQLYYTLIDRAIWLEGAVLRLPTWEQGYAYGGTYAARPYGNRLFGLFEVSHARGLALVYAVVLGDVGLPDRAPRAQHAVGRGGRRGRRNGPLRRIGADAAEDAPFAADEEGADRASVRRPARRWFRIDATPSPPSTPGRFGG